MSAHVTEDPLVGTEVGRYRITRRLGEGGMGCVYEARNDESGAVVAIKVLSERYAEDRGLVERFFAEARAANVIAHENIVTVHDLAQFPDGRPYIVMELLRGDTLRALIASGPLPVGGVLHVVIEVLAALAATHRAGIVHRDLKPDNIFVTTKGRAKVLDFGIAKLVGANAVKRTQTGVVLGTPEYMSPEQIQEGVAEARSDLYALGVVLFEALTGKRPFRATTDFELMRAHVEDPPPLPCSMRPDLPAALDHIVACALAKDPRERFASAAAMANALYQVATTVSTAEWRSVVPGGRLMTPRPPSLPPILEVPTEKRTAITVAARPPVKQVRKAAPARARMFVALAAIATAGVAGAVFATHVADDAPEASRVAVAARASDAAIERRTAEVASPPAPLEPIATTAETETVDAAPPSRGPRDDTNLEVKPPRPVANTVVDAGVDAGAAVEKPVSSSTAKFDATDFDWRAYYHHALRLARELEVDAGLVTLQLDGVMPDGRVDLTVGSGSRTFYEFESRATKSNACRIRVTMTPRGPQVVRDGNGGPCTTVPVGLPGCTSKQIREKARIIQTVTANKVAVLVYERLRSWTVVAGGKSVSGIVDDCNRPSHAPPLGGHVENEARNESSRPLAQDEVGRVDVKAFATDATMLAHDLEDDARIVTVVVRWSFRSPARYTVDYNMHSTRLARRKPQWCLVVEVRDLEATAKRTQNCAKSQIPIAMPKCAARTLIDRLEKRHNAVGISLFWTTSWQVNISNGKETVERFTIEDDC